MQRQRDENPYGMLYTPFGTFKQELLGDVTRPDSEVYRLVAVWENPDEVHVLNCRQTNLYSPEANAAFEQAQYFVKTQPVTARQVPKGQSELVVVRSGATRDTAAESDWIVQSFSGEEYVVHQEDFDQLYIHIDGNRFMPVRDPRKLVRVQEDIVFASPWGNGELQTVRKGGYIIERVIRSGSRAGQRERYGIAQKDAEPDFKPTRTEPHERF